MNDSERDPIPMGRRDLIKAGLVAAPLLLGAVPRVRADETKQAVGAGPYPARAYGTAKPDAPLGPINIERRALHPNDVLLEVLYCGICHSDIHQARDEWKSWGPTAYPCVPGHEIIGRVAAVGNKVTKFKIGDIGGVGCMVNSCRTCDNCVADREQNCSNRPTFTYNSPDPDKKGERTNGGYSDKLVVTEHFVIRIPPGMDLAATAPLLCAGVTTFSPMQHWKLAAKQRVGVIGLGGLGHMAVKLAVARKADVTVFTTSPGKIDDAKKMGAKEAVLWSDAEALKRLANSFDLLISTVPQAYSMQPFVNVLKMDATLVNVGAMEAIQGLIGIDLVHGRKSIAGSLIGGIAETQDVIDYCAARNIKADVELVSPTEINKAFDRVVNKDVRYRFVIDMTKK
jgi:uncharacterized zinc-type alcohol dehydrogenase-like protein